LGSYGTASVRPRAGSYSTIVRAHLGSYSTVACPTKGLTAYTHTPTWGSYRRAMLARQAAAILGPITARLLENALAFKKSSAKYHGAGPCGALQHRVHAHVGTCSTMHAHMRSYSIGCTPTWGLIAPCTPTWGLTAPSARPHWVLQHHARPRGILQHRSHAHMGSYSAVHAHVGHIAPGGRPRGVSQHRARPRRVLQHQRTHPRRGITGRPDVPERHRPPYLLSPNARCPKQGLRTC